jgi:hypothetical protein
MAGYSGTPLPQKLGIKPGHAVALVEPPKGFTKTLGTLPAGVTVTTGLAGRGALDVIVAFVTTERVLANAVAKARPRLTPAGGLWIAWPKRTSGVTTELTENVVREILLASGLVDNKVCAIDETWSGLRGVIRLADRPAPVSKVPKKATTRPRK